ncbi:glycosyltransferase family 4 protein [Erwinia sp. V71]|uniref:glycosyltransferase family 4 protein n=1 Tax=Erwinia sp. V71 TaxID=3369424 RepID=UPI003F6394D6
MSVCSNSFSTDNRKRIAVNILLGDVSAKGGIERVSISLANALADNYYVKIISLYQSRHSLPFKISDSVTLQVLESSYEESMYNRKRGLFSGLFFDFVYILRKKKKLSLFCHSDSVTISCDTKMTLLAKLSGCKNVIAIEHFEYDTINSLLKSIRKILYRKISAVVTLTHEDKDKYFWLDQRQHKIIPNIVESPEVILPDSERENTVLAVGRFVEQKGFDLLIDAWSAIPESNWTLKIIGDGPGKNSLEDMIKKMGVKKVSLEPFKENISEDYQRAKIFVLSSRYEGLGMVLIEALANGLACVSFDCPAGPKTILNKSNGILVEAENTKKLSAALMSLMDDERLRLKYSACAPGSISEYRKKQVLMNWEKLIEQVVS